MAQLAIDSANLVKVPPLLLAKHKTVVWLCNWSWLFQCLKKRHSGILLLT